MDAIENRSQKSLSTLTIHITRSQIYVEGNQSANYVICYWNDVHRLMYERGFCNVQLCSKNGRQQHLMRGASIC